MSETEDLKEPEITMNQSGDEFKLPDGMTKKLIAEGEGDERPKDGCEVQVHYTGTLEDGTEFDSSHSRNEPFSFTLGLNSVIKGWELALRTMRRSEIAEFSIPSQLAYGESGAPPTIPPNARLIFTIELIDWTSEDHKGKPIHKLTLSERLDGCQERKQAGGELFKEGKYEAAIREYRKLMELAQISDFVPNKDGRVAELDTADESILKQETDEEKEKRAELKRMLLVGYLNLAICYLKVKKVKESIQNCQLALDLDPNNVKAHFRIGMAYSFTNDYEKAVEQFDKVLSLDPNNAEAKAQKNACNIALKTYYQKQKDIYKNLFSSK